MEGGGSGPIQASFSISPLKEPIGFIKVIEFVLSIFAFATTTSHETSTTFNINCTAVPHHEVAGEKSVTFTYSYSYDLEDVCFRTPICNNTKTGEMCLLSGSESSAQFYVFVGVIVFLYCLAALVLYIFFDELYRRNTRIVIVDFVVSVVLTLLWIIGSSAWASGVSDVKMYTDPDEGSIFDNLAECKNANANCRTVNDGNFASLNVSIIFGFLNFVVWVGNLWFLYKETPWFKVQARPPSTPAPDVSVIPNSIPAPGAEGGAAP
ncbi:synaptophysin-like protein 1 [Aplysia californica]|uniref:Synaptophysin-like protein 1 n=1 Tax=Aplysia californica TaxID=6500 RepID=A0ABM0ZZF9_APLCA|nr:synaptophysin-like protein 1 [Aplysia californica]